MNNSVSQLADQRLQLSGISLRGLLLHIRRDLVRLPATTTLRGHFATHSCRATQGSRALCANYVGSSIFQSKRMHVYYWMDLL